MTLPLRRAAIAGSTLFHLVLVLWLWQVKQSVSAPQPEPVERKRVVTHLIDPPTELTQRAPNRAPLSKELIAEAILPRPTVRTPAPAPVTANSTRKLPLPARTPPAPPQPTPQPQPRSPSLVEPPKIEIGAREVAKLPQATPPPPVEKPKLVLETPPSQPAPVPKSAANPSLLSHNPIEDAVRNAARGASGAQSVGDAAADLEAPGPGLNLPPSAGRPRSSLELKSDPQGVDFKPYLLRVLATVRRNWFAIYPESARMGQRGRVLVEFAVAPDGTITKVVFSQQSGSRPLDEAAVAALSASNRLPPLPQDFKGNRVVLQFTFSYNMAVR